MEEHTNEDGRRTIIIDIEPDWMAVIEWYVDCLHHNYVDEEGKQLARKEILRVAKIMSQLRRAQKADEDRTHELWSEILRIGGGDEEE